MIFTSMIIQEEQFKNNTILLLVRLTEQERSGKVRKLYQVPQMNAKRNVRKQRHVSNAFSSYTFKKYEHLKIKLKLLLFLNVRII